MRISLPWRRALRMVAFVLAVAMCLELTGWFLTPRSNRYLTGYTAGGILGEKRKALDVIVMGDSNAANGISPMEWYREKGITGYTYGVGWFNVFKAYYRLRTVLQEQKPKVVFLCTGMVFSKQSDESYFNMAVWSVLGELVPAVRFHDQWKKLTLHSATQSEDYSWRDPNKGYNYVTDCTPHANLDYMSGSGQDKMPFGAAAYLGRIRDLCEENGVRLVLITVPSATSWNIRRHNAIAAWAAENDLTYLDYNLSTLSPGIDWTQDTADGGTHLNYSGAKKVTDALGAYLSDMGGWSDHRGQSRYKAWDKDLKTYLTTIGATN